MTGIAPLPWPEFSYRAGLLLGAGLFLHAGLGAPWSHGLLGFAGIALAALFVTIPAGAWEALGDWRDMRRRALLIAFACVVWIATAAAISPSVQGSALPDGFETKLAAALGFERMVPMGSLVIGMFGAMASFAVFFAAAFCLMLSRKPARQAPLVFAAVMLASMIGFFHPSFEVAIGLMMLGMFAWVSREAALMLPVHILASLDARQRSFLIHVRKHGAIPAAEVPLLLPAGESELRQMYDLKLIDWEEESGDILPSQRLMGVSTESSAWPGRLAWLALGAFYFLFPDLIPGPIDDIIVMALCSYAGLRNPLAQPLPDGR